MTERAHTDRMRAESFGALAEQYDRERPGYPDALVDDLVEARPADALDIGSGTGKAAVLLAARGVQVLGVEVDERMSAVARARGVPVEIAPFETWPARERHFDLVVCGQAWHWIDPAVGPGKARDVLRPNGLLGLFWNFAHFDSDTQRARDAAYVDAAPELSRHSVVRGGGPATVPGHVAGLRAAGLGAVEHRRYEWFQWLLGRTMARARRYAQRPCHSADGAPCRVVDRSRPGNRLPRRRASCAIYHRGTARPASVNTL